MGTQAKRVKSASRIALEEAIGNKIVVARPYGVAENDNWGAERQADVLISNIRLSIIRGTFQQNNKALPSPCLTLEENFNRRAKIQLPWYELKTELTREDNHHILVAAVKAAAEEAGVNPHFASVEKRERFFPALGPKVFIMVPSERVAKDLLTGVTPPRLG